MSTFYTGLGTIIAGIITAIVHIIITIKASESAIQISNDNLHQQKTLFSKTKTFDFLNSKKENLEKTINELSEIQYGIKIEERNQKIIRHLTHAQFVKVKEIVNKSIHYLDDKDFKLINDYIKKFNNDMAEFDSDITIEESDLKIKDIGEFGKKGIESTSLFPEPKAIAIEVLKTELVKTTKRIEAIIAED